MITYNPVRYQLPINRERERERERENKNREDTNQNFIKTLTQSLQFEQYFITRRSTQCTRAMITHNPMTPIEDSRKKEEKSEERK